MKSSWNYPGARWWKFDFHTHTPASKDTGAWQAAIGTPQELTPENWLLKYMAAEIDCVAVTDHNTGEWIDRLKATYAAMKRDAEAGNVHAGFRELHLFPGVEISVQGGVHLLAIFDQDASSTTIASVLGGVGFPAHLHGETDDKDGAAITRDSLLHVIEEVQRSGGIAIPAHVDDLGKGLLRLLPGSRSCVLEAAMVKQALLAPGILALEWKVKDVIRPSVWDEIKPNLASVVGSDCHSFQGTAVPGSRYTWIKMAIPSLQGLRLALLDGQEISVRRSDDGDGFAPFNKPEHFIESIEIRDARFMGRGKEAALLKFNPYFNAVIGGRGTGKSTVVHALRLAYRREKELEPSSDAGQTFNRFNKVAKNRSDEGGLLAETALSVQVSRDGTLMRLHWPPDGQRDVVEEWDVSSQSFKSSASQAISEQRFPIRLFSQGQIAALAGDSQQALLKVIDDAAGTSTQQSAFNEAKRAFLATRAQMRELDGKLKGRDALSLGLQDVHRKLARFEGADHAVVLKNYQRTSRQSRELDRQFESAADLAARLKAFAQDLLAEDLPEGLFDACNDGTALQIVQKLKAAIEKARIDVERAALLLDEQGPMIKGELEASPWFFRVRDAKSAYDKLKADLQQQGVSDPSEYGRLVQEKQRLETELKRLDALQKQHDTLKEKVMNQIAAVREARRSVSEHRIVFLNRTLADNPYVRMELLPFGGNASEIERSLRDLLGINDGRFARDIYREDGVIGPEGLVPKVIESTNKEESIRQVQQQLVRACNGEGDLGADIRNRLQKTTESKPELVDHICCWFPEDGLQVEYSRKGDGKDFQSIGQASAGQRAAAMLAFLLAHGSEPLVLDQPEDDLDNHLIYGLVVQQIRSNKLRRQLIIVTHNPNIVVNGDAELIHVLDFNHQCYVKQPPGSLQDQSMRKEVCQIMEGGKEAFERRYQRLGRKV
ncbi:MAG: hypothetical protein RLZZ298_1472 [Pseudomonadota bacterium]|jgi:energy-coupling factor transporter ATP-binding protein EcfA2